MSSATKHRPARVKRNLDRVNNSSWLDIPAKVTPVSLVLPANLTYDQWAEIGLKIARVKRFCSWALSDWLNFGSAKYGETFSQAADATGFQPDYLAIIKYVGANVDASRRREALSFSHHRLVASLEPEEQERFLSEAEKNGWTREDMAAAVREFKKQIECQATLNGEKNGESTGIFTDQSSGQAVVERTERAFDVQQISQKAIEFLGCELKGARSQDVAEVLAAIINAFAPTGVQRSGAVPYLDGDGNLKHAESVDSAWREIRADHSRQRAAGR